MPAVALGLGAGLFGLSLAPSTVKCDGLPARREILTGRDNLEAQSGVDLYQLSFGSAVGVCAGVFVKKGLKAVAFMLGGIFVLVQYMASRSIVDVDWRALGRRYDSVVKRSAGSGSGNPAVRIFNRFVDFLTADFAPRATFLAGFVLGLRIG